MSIDYELVQFDQNQRDVISRAIEQKKQWLKKHITDDRLNNMLSIYPEDIVDLFAGSIQSEINTIESVEKFFSAHRLYRKK